MNDSPRIVTDKLSKRYDKADVFAIKDISIAVMPGEIYGFLGPNGAGKSTIIRTLMNFIQPTSGSARILGLDSVSDSVAIKRSLGYLSSDMALYPKMTGRQFLTYMNELQPSKASYRRELTKRLKADDTKRLGTLSRGNRQKFAIIQAFMHEPEVLILDEPSSGLDPLMQEVFYELLGEAKARGAAVFMSSHILSEVQKVCDRVGIIREGRLITERSIADMAREAAHTFEIIFGTKAKPPIAELKRIPGVNVVTHDGQRLIINLHGPLAPLLRALGGYDVIQLEARQLDLEELFMRYYSEGEQK